MSSVVHAPPREGMAWIPGGEFRMGDERFYPEEAPVRSVSVPGFWIDSTPVTVHRAVTSTYSSAIEPMFDTLPRGGDAAYGAG